MVLGSRKRAQHVPARHTEVSSGVAGNAFTRATTTCIAARIRGGGEGVGSVVVVLCVECRGCTYPHHFVQCKRSSGFSASCARPQCGDRKQKQMQLSHGLWHVTQGGSTAHEFGVANFLALWTATTSSIRPCIHILLQLRLPNGWGMLQSVVRQLQNVGTSAAAVISPSLAAARCFVASGKQRTLRWNCNVLPFCFACRVLVPLILHMSVY